ncbi:MAG: 12-oxophytodienoate reductase, partial [Gammaproteobacteria bacterium]|nr:12-oxophytodienoate reductase [Gammaproteobacteria bacterium]
SMHKRSSIAIEIVKGIRAACGDDFPIILRFSQWKQQDYSAKLAQTPEELQDFLMPLVDAGVDFFHCSTRRFWEPEFPEDESGNSDLNLAGWTQKLSGKPAITVGSIGLSNDFISERKGETFKNGEVTDIDNLIQRMNNHEFELAAVGRALISNPDWAEKIRTRENADIKPYNAEDLKQLI